jgi:uncharacterized protein with FMN-binding domain
MKKIIYGALATVSGLVLLFSYRTSLGADLVPAPVARASSGATTGTSGGGTTSDTSDGADDAGSGTAGDGGDASTGAGATDGSTSSGGTTSEGTSNGSTSGTSSSSLKDGSYTGDAAQTRYGPVQVRITVSGGKITTVDVPEYPAESPRDEQINRFAVPQLVSETISAQSAQIDMVSGATFTTDGYLQSLQSALDQAAR